MSDIIKLGNRISELEEQLSVLNIKYELLKESESASMEMYKDECVKNSLISSKLLYEQSIVQSLIKLFQRVQIDGSLYKLDSVKNTDEKESFDFVEIED